ncbi:ABC transporter permease subunit [Oscillatoria laete-virens NRMC-F 0139]|nr:ABC transporter permease subunit [Oscillatoria laete-virens]MDL5053693.1 ABC transporter permease subunit [Oscillatoria laete-virens NRMC-F 0139]
MSLISNVGRKKGKGLLVILSFYVVLLFGGVTMIIPFLMTLSTSVTNQYDSARYSLYPRFVFDRDELFCKYIFLKYFAGGGSYNYINNLYKIQKADTMTDFNKVKSPLKNIFGPLGYYNWDEDKLKIAYEDWVEYWDDLRRKPLTDRGLPVLVLYPSINTIKFQAFLKDRYLELWREQNPDLAKTLPEKEQTKGALALMNSIYGRTIATEFHRIGLQRGDSEFGRTARFVETPRVRDYEDFVRSLPADQVTLATEALGVGTSDWAFVAWLKNKYITLARLNEAWGTGYQHFGDIIFPEKIPHQDTMAADWKEFVQTTFPLADIRVTGALPHAEFRQWLLRKHRGSLDTLNKAYNTTFKSMDEILLSEIMPQPRLLRAEWADFIVQNIPLDRWIVNRPDKGYREFLERKYSTVEKLNQTYGQNYQSFDAVILPQTAFDRMDFLNRPGELLRFFLTNNFIQVFKFIGVQGNAMWNTFILVGAFLIAGLTVNPLAAYALSRYKIKFKQLILIMFLVPMAFPGEVMQIPGFILTRDLGLLNTYWALILPGLANGFGIFLMKGFFDGLPRELYEAAELDGANEWQIYWTVTFPMCKPIIALQMMGTIIAAYSEYMWAFIVCPDERKWTLAVWIFQYSMDAMQRGEAHLQMAALVLMSIPTLFIFIIMQKIIMKGIILPSMK